MNNRHSLLIQLLVLISSVVLTGVIQAQDDGGQFCVRAYEDTNGNGLRDAGEALLTHSVGANLLDAQGIIFDSATLDTSPLSDRGLVCFDNLPDGQYTILATSAEYLPTGLDNMTAVINSKSLLVYFDFGGQMAGSSSSTVLPVNDAEESQKDDMIQLIVALGGAVFTMLVTIIIGFTIYLLVLRQPWDEQPIYDPALIQPDQQYMRPTESYPTGQQPPIQPPPPYTDDY